MTTAPHPSLSQCRCGLPMRAVLNSLAGTYSGVVGCEHCDVVCRIGSSCERCAASRTAEARS